MSGIPDLIGVLAEMDVAWNLLEKLHTTLPMTVFAGNEVVQLSFEAYNFPVPLELSLYRMVA